MTATWSLKSQRGTDGVPIEAYHLSAARLNNKYESSYLSFYRHFVELWAAFHPFVVFNFSQRTTLERKVATRILGAQELSVARYSPQIIYHSTEEATTVFFSNAFGMGAIVRKHSDHLGVSRLSCVNGQIKCTYARRDCLEHRAKGVFKKISSLLLEDEPPEGNRNEKGWTTFGMPTVEQAHSLFLADVKTAFYSSLGRGTRTCSRAAAQLFHFLKQLEEKVGQIGTAAVHSALVHYHSSVSQEDPISKAPLPREVLFHRHLGNQRAQVIGGILELVGSTSVRPVLKAVEIGVDKAGTSFNLLDRFPNLELWSIDPYLNKADPSKKCPLFDRVKQLLSRFGRRSRLWKLTSAEASCIFNNTVDLVFLDGLQDYENYCEDIKRWEGFVRRGGAMSGHNYGDKPGVMKAVHERVVSLNTTLHLGPDITWWYFVPDPALAPLAPSCAPAPL